MGRLVASPIRPHRWTMTQGVLTHSPAHHKWYSVQIAAPPSSVSRTNFSISDTFTLVLKWIWMIAASIRHADL